MNTETDLTMTPRTKKAYQEATKNGANPKYPLESAKLIAAECGNIERELNVANEKLRQVKEYPIGHKPDCLISVSTFNGVTFGTKCTCKLQDLLEKLK